MNPGISNPIRTLLVDDDRNIRQTLQATLRTLGCDAHAASSAEEAIEALGREDFDFLLTDFRMGSKSGLDVVRAARERPNAPLSVVMTAYASFENAVDAMKEGAFDYLPKPFSNAQLGHVIKKVSTVLELKRENLLLRQRNFLEDYFEGMTSPAMSRLKSFVNNVAGTDAPVLMLGESGTGKTELAKVIHRHSRRAEQPLFVLNCTDFCRIPSGPGTVFLDEIGDLALADQARLLQILNEHSMVSSVGTPTATDMRVLAATNSSLEEAVHEGRFREDLYYRLNTFECSVVSLRHRREDIPVLIERFRRGVLARIGEPDQKQIPEDVLKRLMAYSWPGNIRELKNVIERIVFLSKGRTINLEDLPESMRSYSKQAFAKSSNILVQTLEELEKDHIQRVLETAKSQEHAATLLGITTVTLWRKRKQYGLP